MFYLEESARIEYPNNCLPIKYKPPFTRLCSVHFDMAKIEGGGKPSICTCSHPHTCSPTQRSDSGIQNPKFTPAHILTHAQIPTDLESKICISLDPHTCLPNQISEIHPKFISAHILTCPKIWNTKSKIFTSSHPHTRSLLTIDLESKIRTNSYPPTCSPAQRFRIQNPKFASDHILTHALS